MRTMRTILKKSVLGWGCKLWMYAVYILMIRTARKAVPISEHTLYNYIRKLREVLSKDKEISITTQNNGYELHIST